MLAAAVVALVALIVSARADASPYVAYGVQDDAWLLAGPGTLDERLTKLDELGVDLVRVNLRWNEIAARRPARPSLHGDPPTGGRPPTCCWKGCERTGSDRS